MFFRELLTQTTLQNFFGIFSIDEMFFYDAYRLF